MSNTTTQNIPNKTGSEVIRNIAKNLSNLPGVYRMIAADGRVLYVGKAKNLKNRVSSYVTPASGKGWGLSTRIMRMVENTASMEIITTHSEVEALLLEATLIKQLKPHYNILLRDDKSYPYIFLGADHNFPQISKHRGTQTRKGEYFGPFASIGAMNETLALLQRAFLLRPCTDNIFHNRTRPCLQYQIKRCSAPCVGRISKEDYAQNMQQAQDFLHGKSREIQSKLQTQMQEYSANFDYENAAHCRDRIRALTQIQSENQDFTEGVVLDADVIGLYQASGYVCVQVFFFRGGNHYGNRAFFPANAQTNSAEEVLEAFVSQFYNTHQPPKQILLSHEVSPLLQEALSLSAEQKIDLLTPKRGAKQQLVQNAIENAQQALARHMAETQQTAALLEKLAKIFELPQPPQRIEIYDNSHIQGTHAVGAMVVATPEGFDKKSYRKFNFKCENLKPGDDYGMMHEMLTRRFVRMLEDPPPEEGSKPDLVLIDGGAGQLSTALKVLKELGINDIKLAGIAKGVDRNAGREEIFLPQRAPFRLPENDQALHFIQRLRDEAHRFAITSHRAKRSKAIQTSSLDEVPGIGAIRKKALINHFGSARDVEAASVEALQQVAGISQQMAQGIFDFFRG